METIKKNDILSEQLIINTLPSGLKCYIIPKKDYVEKQAMISTKYGSLDNIFNANGERKNMPEGIAHFLEHKMFEQAEGGNVFDKFMRNGADCNAFTNFTTTAYYFNCIDNFGENLKLLLSFTQNPHFTDENVEKEKGIIAQEISMYNDDPKWSVYFNLLRALYNVNPIKNDIAGTVESIEKINKDMLYECYNIFYNPSNMALVVAGDVCADEICEIADQAINKKDGIEIERIYGDEPDELNERFIEKNMSVSHPLFNIGFKDNNYATDMEKHNAETKVLLDILMGESGPLYGQLYNEGLIDSNFDANYMNSLYFGNTVIGGFSNSPEKVRDKITEEINRLKREGIDDNVFNRIKRKHTGRMIKGLNSIDAVVYGQTEYFTKNTDLINIFEAYHNLCKDDIIKRLNEHFDENFMALSIIKP